MLNRPDLEYDAQCEAKSQTSTVPVCESCGTEIHKHPYLLRLEAKVWYGFRKWLIELDDKHSGRQGAIWQEIAEMFKVSNSR